nr:zinc finger, CCHC-type, retrotransposon Gag domain protein [Tanacetum cinerariifolium]
MHDEFEMSMMEELKILLGRQIKQIEDGIFFNQSKYIKEMLKKFRLEDSKPTKTLMSTEIKLTKDDKADFVDSTKYRGIREEFRTSSGPLDSGGNPPLITIHTWLERFNKQKPRSFEKATAPVDAENWISHMEKIFDVMGCEAVFKTRLAVYKFEGNAL